MDAIAERAGVNKQGLYYHFGSKEKLFEAAFAAIYGQPQPDWSQWRNDTCEPAEALQQLVGAVFDLLRGDRPGTWLIADENHAQGAHLTPAVRRRMRTSIAPLIEALDRALKAGVATGDFSDEFEATDIYLTIVALSIFYFTNAYTLSAIIGRDLRAPLATRRWKRHVQCFVLSAVGSRRA